MGSYIPASIYPLVLVIICNIYGHSSILLSEATAPVTPLVLDVYWFASNGGARLLSFTTTKQNKNDRSAIIRPNLHCIQSNQVNLDVKNISLQSTRGSPHLVTLYSFFFKQRNIEAQLMDLVSTLRLKSLVIPRDPKAYLRLMNIHGKFNRIFF